MTTKTEAERAATPAYIGRAPCGCIRFACVDEPVHAKDNAKEIAKLIRDGWTVERVTVQFVRDNWGPGCEQCEPKSERKRKASAATQETLL